MPIKTLDEYIKQATNQTTTKQPTSATKYRIVGFYKETELQEIPIGEILKDWKITRLRELFSYVKGRKPKILVKEKKEGYLPYLTTDYLRTGIPSSYARPEKNTILVNESDILLLWDGSNSGEFFLGKKGILASTMVKLLPKDKDNNRLFYFYYLKLNENRLKSLTKGTGIPHVDKAVFENLLLVMPPLEEQWGIAEVLSTVDKAIEATERLIKKLERLKRGLMQELLTKGIGHKEYKQTPIGKIPKEWKVVKLKDIALLIATGSTPSTKNKEYYQGNIAFIKTTEIDNNLIDKATVFISEKAVRDYRLKIFPPGTILIAMYGQGKTRGKVALLKIPATTSQNAAGIVINNKLANPMYVWYYLMSKYQELRRTGVHGQISHLTLRFVSNYRIVLPPLEEQNVIVNILSHFDKWIEWERKRKERLERLKRGLMGLLLTGRVRVKVEPVSK